MPKLLFFAPILRPSLCPPPNQGHAFPRTVNRIKRFETGPPFA